MLPVLANIVASPVSSISEVRLLGDGLQACMYVCMYVLVQVPSFLGCLNCLCKMYLCAINNKYMKHYNN